MWINGRATCSQKSLDCGSNRDWARILSWSDGDGQENPQSAVRVQSQGCSMTIEAGPGSIRVQRYSRASAGQWKREQWSSTINAEQVEPNPLKKGKKGGDWQQQVKLSSTRRRVLFCRSNQSCARYPSHRLHHRRSFCVPLKAPDLHFSRSSLHSPIVTLFALPQLSRNGKRSLVTR